MLIASVQFLLNPLCQNFKDADHRPTLIIGFDHGPWGIRSFRFGEHLVYCGQPVLVFAMLATITAQTTPSLTATLFMGSPA